MVGDMVGPRLLRPIAWALCTVPAAIAYVAVSLVTGGGVEGVYYREVLENAAQSLVLGAITFGALGMLWCVALSTRLSPYATLPPLAALVSAVVGLYGVDIALRVAPLLVTQVVPGAPRISGFIDFTGSPCPSALTTIALALALAAAATRVRRDADIARRAKTPTG